MKRTDPRCPGHLIISVVALAWLIGLAGASSARAQASDAERAAAEVITSSAERGIERGMAWLVARQHDDGSFGSGAYRGNVAVTGLAGMALMSGGSTPDRGPHGAAIARIVDYLLSRCQQSGYIIDRNSAGHGPMYGHGFATMFLAECHGMTERPELREKLAAAVTLIVEAQNSEGGWRYHPQPTDADVSVTVCQMMALRAARNAGIFVPPETVRRCLAYIRACQNADGGFMYMQSNPGDSAFPRSAAALVGLYSAGVYEGPAIERGIEYMVQFTPTPGAARRETYYFYGHYYAVQAAWQRGGETWQQWYPAIRDQLLQRQTEDGYWSAQTVDRTYGTAMALIVLQVPNNYLPIFQR